MDWSGLLRETFDVMRRGRPLWQLAIVSAIQAGLYGVLALAVILPMTLLTQVLVQAGTGSSGLPPDITDRYVPQAVAWISANQAAIVAGAVVLFLLWIVAGVFDIAATAGSISQACSVADGRPASFAQGMRDGFRVWLRTIGVLAVAAIPALVSLAGVAALMLVTVTIPLAQGQQPSAVAMAAGNGVNSLLSTVSGIVGIPLLVIAQLGMRFIVVEDMQWKPAWLEGWKMTKERLGDVAITYVIQLGVTMAVALIFTVILAVLGGALGAVALAMANGAGSLSGAAVVALTLGVAVAVVLAVVCSALVVLWQSVLWTLAWRRMRQTGQTTHQPAPSVKGALSRNLGG